LTATGNQQPHTHDSDELYSDALGRHIIFYDGVCGLCNKFIQFVIDNDTDGRFFFAALQSDFAKNTLGHRGADAESLNTVYVLSNYGDAQQERLYNKSDAVAFTTGQLKPWIKPIAFFIKIFPKPLRDFGYETVAKIRYKLFGKYDQCMLPSPETRARFIAT
jgi:predicted DCC family thiol-disulfide oxidoreductase YuxK